MIELRLVGYTGDLEHLVLEVTGSGDGERYRLVVEPDLFATVDDVRRQRREAGKPVGDVVEFAERLGIDRDALRAVTGRSADDGSDDGGGDAPADRAGEPDTAADGTGGDDAAGDAAGEPAGRSPFAPPPGEDGGPETGDADASDGDADGDGPDGTQDVIPTVRLLDGDAEDAGTGDGTEREPVPGGALEAILDQGGERGDGDGSADGGEAGAPADQLATGTGLDPAGDDADGAADDGDGGTAAAGADERPPAEEPVAGGGVPGDAEGDGPGRPDSRLSPAEIQAELRAGRSARAVAEEADTDLAWIRRWQVPIEAERSRILEEARRLYLERPRLGTSRDPLGAAVRHNLSGPTVEDGSIDWSVARRANGRWRVRVSYTQRGRERQATWTYDPGEGEVRAASPKARRLGFTRLQE